MNWRHKARLARMIARLPSGLSYRAYYLLQRYLGALRTVNPVRAMKTGVAMVDAIHQQGAPWTGAETVLEVGTGWSLSLPFALWLCGAFRIVTVDLNPYLKPQLVWEEIEYLKKHKEIIWQLFEQYSQQPQFRERWELLVQDRHDFHGLLRDMNIQYISPANAGQLDLPSRSIDYHVSFMVAQHVRPEVLCGILREGKRLLKPSGLFIHYATLTDLFAGVDRSISPVNFLQFSEAEWEAIAGNRYMYHNRLRVDELCEIFTTAGLKLLRTDPSIDQESLRVLRKGELALAPRFKEKSPETNATGKVWITAAPA